MPVHRFFAELNDLEQNPITGQYNILVIGTFNAADQVGLVNDAEWFYGRNKNQFWFLFPQLLGYHSLHRREHPNVALEALAEEWRNFCGENGIKVVDIFKTIEGVLPNHGDGAIENPLVYETFNYEQAFGNCTFDHVLFTWKGRTLNNTLGVLKENAHDWFIEQGAVVHHMITPSPVFRRPREWKLEWWLNEFQGQ